MSVYMSSNLVHPDWEARRDGTGRQVYYDHEHKVVRLDKPDQETGQSSLKLHVHVVQYIRYVFHLFSLGGGGTDIEQFVQR